MPTLSTLTLDSPCGPLRLLATPTHLRRIDFIDGKNCPVVHETTPADPGQHLLLREAADQLVAYFAGGRSTFDLPLEPLGTEFQRTVWTALRAIPFGETRSYAQLARAIDRPTASRAVGAANGRNPLSIVVPCHRVLGASGTLTGFAGGLDAKRTLLNLECSAPALAN